MYSRSIQRLSFISLAFLLSLTIAFVLFVYQVSPLRDPSFQPNSANAGTLVPWLQDVPESHWVHSATLLSALLAANIMIVLWSRTSRSDSWFFIKFATWFAAWLGVWGLLWLAFISHLMSQWLVD